MRELFNSEYSLFMIAVIQVVLSKCTAVNFIIVSKNIKLFIVNGERPRSSHDGQMENIRKLISRISLIMKVGM